MDTDVIFGNGYDMAKDKGIFFFGHKPPNIQDNCGNQTTNVEDLGDPLASMVPETPNDDSVGIMGDNLVVNEILEGADVTSSAGVEVINCV
jgi:hypothetical protein